MHKRLKQLRIALDLSQSEFGTRIGLRSRGHISALESGMRNISDRIVSDICRVYNINEEWLRTGRGEMFVQVPDTFANTLIKEHGLTGDSAEILTLFLKLPPDLRDAFMDIMRKLVAGDDITINKKDYPHE